MRIDAHQHFWHIANRQGRWPPPALAPIYRDFAPADLLPALRRCRIAGTVLVQSLPSMGDTEFMLDLALRHDFILGVVGWVDLKSAGAPLHIAHLAQYRKFKGLRAMLQDLSDDRWIDDPALDLAVQCMVDHGLSFDALVLQRQLPALRSFARRHPDLSDRGRSRRQARDRPRCAARLAARDRRTRPAGERALQAVRPAHRRGPGLQSGCGCSPMSSMCSTASAHRA